MTTQDIRRNAADGRMFGTRLAFCIGLALLLGIPACKAPGPIPDSHAADRLQRFEFRKLLMGVGARIVLFAPDEETAVLAASSAFARIADLEAVLSDYRSDSEIMRLRATLADATADLAPAETAEIPISDDLALALRLSMDLRARTDGAFDERMGELTSLWRLARNGITPQNKFAWELAFDRMRQEYRVVDLESGGSAISARGVVFLDFGGIGKGFACDQAAHVLRSHAIDRFLIDMGGDLLVGKPPPTQPGWRVAIEGDSSSPGYVVLAERGIATSGAREQFLEIEGERFSHILDPRRGEPLRHTRSVTVIAADAATADALASALSVLGASAMREIEDRFEDLHWRVEESADRAEERSAGFPDLIPPQSPGQITREPGATAQSAP